MTYEHTLYDSRGSPFGLNELVAFQHTQFELRGVVDYKPGDPVPRPEGFNHNTEEYRPVVVTSPPQQKSFVVQYVRPLTAIS